MMIDITLVITTLVMSFGLKNMKLPWERRKSIFRLIVNQGKKYWRLRNKMIY